MQHLNKTYQIGTTTNKTVLVFGATGQQGGAVAKALRSEGWGVRALVRNKDGGKAKALSRLGIELVDGDFEDRKSIRDAMNGTYGVFSVQTSSGQGTAYGVMDATEIRYGKTVADIALDTGIQHLVYSSSNAAGPTKTGMGHFDSKIEIEEHIRRLPIVSTIVRPSTFMEILTLPGLGLEKGELTFFMRSDQLMQFIAVEDIGRIVARVFGDFHTYSSRTIEIAGDAVTGSELARKFSAAIRRPFVYRRFSDTLLQQNPFLNKLAGLIDEGRLAGKADIPALRKEFPGLLTIDQWLNGYGRHALLVAITAERTGVSLR